MALLAENLCYFAISSVNSRYETVHMKKLPESFFFNATYKIVLEIFLVVICVKGQRDYLHRQSCSFQT